MADWDNDYDDGRRGGGSHGTQPFADTSNFNTAMLSEDGRFLGIRVPPGMEQFLNFTQGGILKYLSDKIESLSLPAAEKVSKWLISDEAKAFKAAGKVTSAIGYGVILSTPITGVGRAIYDSADALNNLRLAVKPLSKSGGTGLAPLSGDNEVVENARRKINGVFWMRVKNTGAKSISILPALISSWHEKTEHNTEREKNRAIDHTKNSKELADLLEKERSGNVSKKAQGSAKKMEEAERIMLDRAKKRYEERMQSYVSKHSAKISEELTAEIDKLSTENFRYTVSKLKSNGFETWDLQNAANRYGVGSEQLQSEIDKFKASSKKHMDLLASDMAERRFQKEYGSLDDQRRNLQNWLHERRTGKSHDEHKNAKETDEHTKRLNEFAAGFGAAAVSEVVGKVIGEDQLKKLSQSIAIDRILHLRRELEKSGNNPPDRVPGIQSEKGRAENDMSYAEYVHTIFRQHQRDSGRADIGERFYEHLNNARWEDSAIQQLPDEQLTAYEFAVKTISKRIKDGRMDAIALINLVGNRNLKMVHNDGRTFGPKGAGKGDEAIKAAMLKVIDEQTALAHAGQIKSDVDVNEKLGNFVFSVDDMKSALTSDTMDKQQRAFVFTVFSDAVGNEAELCKMLGIDESRCAALRQETKDTFNATLDGAVLAIADALQTDATLEKKLKLMGKEKDVILGLAERIKQEGKDVADLTADRAELLTLETVAANAAMKGTGLWTKMVEKAKSIPEIISEAKKRREESAAAPPPSEAHQREESWPPGEQLPPAPEGGMERHKRNFADHATREEPIVPGRV